MEIFFLLEVLAISGRLVGAADWRKDQPAFNADRQKLLCV